MSRTFNPSSPEPDDAIPSRLADGLCELHPAPRVPGSVDSAILNGARAHMAGQANRNAQWRFARHGRLLRWAGATAAAAAVAALVMIAVWPHAPAAGPRAVLAGDINGDGRVDILDAYLVARALADKIHTAPPPAAWDVNHDGVVDQKDVDWIANAAVRVGNGAVADDSKLARPVDAFTLAEDLKSMDAADGPSKMALLLSATEARPGTRTMDAHGACTVGIPAPSAALGSLNADPEPHLTKGAAVQ